MLAIVDVCANIHATRHCNEEGYDIMFVYMVKFIQENKELGIDSSHCDKELILEGKQMRNYKINPIVQEDIVQNISLMPMKMEITSIEDFKVHEEFQVESEGDIEKTKEYYDASYEFSSKEEIKTLKAKIIKQE